MIVVPGVEHHNIQGSESYYARRIVEMLMREVKSWDWESFHDCLCDVNGLTRAIKDGNYTLYWLWEPENGMTWLENHDNTNAPHVIKITIVNRQVTLERLRG